MTGLRLVNGSYRTAEDQRSLLGRISPGLAFYSRLFPIVIRAGAKAKRGRYDDDAWKESSLDSVRALEAAGVRFDIAGLGARGGPRGPCVFIGNHMSTLETFALPVLLLPFKKITFVVKQSLVEYPVFGHVMRSRDPITVGRTNPREDLKVRPRRRRGAARQRDLHRHLPADDSHAGTLTRRSSTPSASSSRRGRTFP